jgi:hypothetical protein
MPNSSSSKYVKRHRRRHTKSRRHAKKYTIKKVMRGCSSKQYGGTTTTLGSSSVGGAQNGGVGVELSVAQGTSAATAASQAHSAANLLKLQEIVKVSGKGASEPYTSSSTQNFTAVAPTSIQSGGYKSKHRRHRYKKSIGRRGRSRRFRGSRK